MKVSYSIGKGSRAVIHSIEKQFDNYEFFTYSSIGEMIKESSQRHITFDRIIISSVLLTNPEKELNELNDYIRNYSEGTEVVLTLRAEETAVGNIFTSIFNSPLYTPAILTSRPTIRTMGDLASMDILSLKTKYYVLDKKEDSVLVSSSTKTKEPVGMAVNGEEDSSNSGTTSLDVNEGNVGTNSLEGIGNGGINAEEVQRNFENMNGNFGANKEYTSIEGEVSSSSVDFSGDDLSLGDFGSSHSDTGYLDEDDEEELRKLRDEEAVKVEAVEERRVEPEAELVKVEIQQEAKKVVEPKVERVIRKNMVVFIGIKGTNVTQHVVDEAVKLTRKRGKKIALVDLDYRENGMLGYLDSHEYYKVANEGISKRIPYVEDDVAVFSEGYGNVLSEEMVEGLIRSQLFNSYDIIIVDCPIECLDVMPESLLREGKVVIMVKEDIECMIATSLALTNRKVVSLSKEKYIMGNCEILNKNIRREDVEALKEDLFFANGSWLDRITTVV